MEVTKSSNDTLSFGHALRKAREKQNITLEQASKDLFIKERQLAALEAENFAALPQQTFAKGFAINYARYLKLNVDEMSASFDRAYPNEMRVTKAEDIASPLRPMGTLHRDSRRSFRFNPLLLLAVICVISLAVFLLRAVSNAQSQKEADSQQPTIEEMGNIDQEQGSALNGIEITNSTGSALNLTHADQTNSPTNPQASELEFWVQNKTNLSVIDANGQVLWQGEKGRGSFTLTGNAPFTIKIDNVKNVSLNMNKQPVRLSQYSQNNQAVFKLSP